MIQVIGSNLVFIDIDNATFIVGKAEDVVPSLLEKPEYKECEEFIAVCDPPRAGLRILSYFIPSSILLLIS